VFGERSGVVSIAELWQWRRMVLGRDCHERSFVALRRNGVYFVRNSYFEGGRNGDLHRCGDETFSVAWKVERKRDFLHGCVEDHSGTSELGEDGTNSAALTLSLMIRLIRAGGEGKNSGAFAFSLLTSELGEDRKNLGALTLSLLALAGGRNKRLSSSVNGSSARGYSSKRGKSKEHQ
jgi:hypothetical protein